MYESVRAQLETRVQVLLLFKFSSRRWAVFVVRTDGGPHVTAQGIRQMLGSEADGHVG